MRTSRTAGATPGEAGGVHPSTPSNDDPACLDDDAPMIPDYDDQVASDVEASMILGGGDSIISGGDAESILGDAAPAIPSEYTPAAAGLSTLVIPGYDDPATPLQFPGNPRQSMTLRQSQATVPRRSRAVVLWRL